MTHSQQRCFVTKEKQYSVLQQVIKDQVKKKAMKQKINRATRVLALILEMTPRLKIHLHHFKRGENRTFLHQKRSKEVQRLMHSSQGQQQLYSVLSWNLGNSFIEFYFVL